MNKKLKIATAAVSVVMAGSMAFGMFGCTPSTPNGPSGPTGGSVTVAGNTYADLEIPAEVATTNAAEIVSKLNSTADLLAHVNAKNSAWQRLKAYSEGKDLTTTGKQEKYNVAESYPATTLLRMDIGDDLKRGVAFNSNILTDKVTLPDGKQYNTTDLKPAWASVKETLNLNISDVNSYEKDTTKIDKALSKSSVGDRLEDREIITDGVDTINNNSDKFLDLSNYLDEMPNYKKFLEDYPVVRLSLTSNTNTGAMYAAPYFDGNNDIEKYVLCKLNWVEALLDNTTGGDTATTFKSHAEAKSLAATDYASIQSFMGTTGKINVSVLDKDGAKVAAGIDINYDKALAAAKNASTPLGAAIKAAAGDKEYTTEGAISGNIVDMMNFAINYSHGACTGAQLLKIMQEYIKVAYYVGGTDTAFYTQTGYKLSDVFTGYAAAWDVDLYAALGRCLVTNPSLIKSGKTGNTIGGTNATTLSNLYLVANRQGNMQRMIDTTSFVGELYGVRGLEARNLYSYIDANGRLQDPRGDYESYDAFNAFSKFYAEGLATEKGAGNNGETSYYQVNQVEALSYHDYSNTQTPAGFELDGAVAAGTYDIEAGYNFTSILTPVSKWNTKSKYDQTTQAPIYDTYMRFTESWRSVKNTGFAVPVDAVKNDSAKLAAVLKFIDYMFSDDGQIELSYGPMADANGNGGFWYNREATAAEVTAGKYFKYKGKNYYSDIYYAGKYQPMVTAKVKSLYYGEEVNGVKVSGTGGFNSSAKCVRDYTAFARHVVGSALPIGNKLQSFEYQMTSDMGLAGANVVNKALEAGVIQHVVLDIKGINNNPWYASVPTLLPYTTEEKSINAGAANLVADFAATKYFTNNKGATENLYWQIIMNGYNAAKYASRYDNIGLTK